MSFYRTIYYGTNHYKSIYYTNATATAESGDDFDVIEVGGELGENVVVSTSKRDIMNYNDNTTAKRTSSRSESGLKEANLFEHVVGPVNDTTAVEYSTRSSIKYSSAANINNPGYVCPHGTVCDIDTDGTLIKAVCGIEAQVKITGNASITAGPVFEPVITEVSAGASGSLSMYYVPVMSGVANIENLDVRAFQNDSGYPFLNNGKTLGSYAIDNLIQSGTQVHELCPAPSFGGYIDARYYYPHNFGSITTGALVANVIYHVPFHVHTETAFNTIGIHISSAVAGAGILGISRTRQGQAANLIAQASGTIDTSSTGDKELTINTGNLKPGTYALNYHGNAGPGARLCQILDMGNYSGGFTSDPSTGGTVPFQSLAYTGTLPAVQSITDRTANGNLVPLIWMRNQ